MATPPMPPMSFSPPPAVRPRPGGLTALAVLNFVFGGLGLFGLLALFALLNVAATTVDLMSAGKQSLSEAPGAGSVYFIALLGVGSAGLLIASGIGYLGQKRVLGKSLGNAYGILSLANTFLQLVLLPMGFGFFALTGIAYPIVTLALLNTSFKNDFPY